MVSGSIVMHSAAFIANSAIVLVCISFRPLVCIFEVAPIGIVGLDLSCCQESFWLAIAVFLFRDLAYFVLYSFVAEAY